MAKSKTVKSADKHDTKSAERALRKEKRSKIDGVKKHKGDKSDRKKAEVSKDVVLTEKPTQADEQMQKALALNVKRIRAMFSDKHYRLPFANPLVTEREEIILLKVLLAGDPLKRVGRGVKEVIKAIRSVPKLDLANRNPGTQHPYVVIMASDVYPPEVVSQVPVLCEDRQIDFVFTRSRELLGLCNITKRPVSILFVRKFELVKKPNPNANNANNKTLDANKGEGEKGEQVAFDVKGEMAKKETDAATIKDWEGMFDNLAWHVRKLRGGSLVAPAGEAIVKVEEAREDVTPSAMSAA